MRIFSKTQGIDDGKIHDLLIGWTVFKDKHNRKGDLGQSKR